MRKHLDPWLFLILLVASALMLSSLDNGRLWQDEAETAVLAKNILSFGYPTAFDGVNLLNPSLRFREGFVWTYHTWLPMYLAAASFFLFGITTWAARFPFVLLGIASIWLASRLIYRITQDQMLSRWTAVLMTTSVPFLLHMRECRYYAPSVFFSLWMSWAYLRFLKQRPWSNAELALSGTLLFHSNHGVFMPVVLALGLHFLWSRPTSALWRSAVKVALATALCTVPFMLYLEAWQHHVFMGWKELSRHVSYYFRQINKFILPIPFWALLAFLNRKSLAQLWGKPGSSQRQGWALGAFLLGVGILFLIYVPWQRHFRYLIYLLPWLLMLQAVGLVAILRWRRSLGLALAAVLIFTDLLHYSGPSILGAQVPAIRAQLNSPDVQARSFPLEYVEGLITPFRGPIDGIVEYLLAHAQPGETLKTPPSEDHPLLFYTKMKMIPLKNRDAFAEETYPDWILIRRAWVPKKFLFTPYYAKIKARYREIVLDAPDSRWQNRPDPGYHKFKTDQESPPVLLYQKR